LFLWSSAPKGRITLAQVLIDAGALAYCGLGRRFINDEGEVADLGLARRVRAVLARLVLPVGWHYDLESVLDDRHLQRPIDFGRCGQGWRRVYFDQPRLQSLVDQHVEAVYLVAVLVVDDDRLDGLEGDVNDVADSFETFFCQLLATCHLKVEFHVLELPLATVDLVVVLGVFLHGDVRQVNHHVVELGDIRRVFLRAKTGESCRVPMKNKYNHNDSHILTAISLASRL